MLGQKSNDSYGYVYAPMSKSVTRPLLGLGEGADLREITDILIFPILVGRRKYTEITGLSSSHL